MKKFLSLLLTALLTASLVLPAGAAFVDVGEGRWYAGAVDYVTGHGLFQGVGGGKFDPYGTMTRGMFVLVLSRVAKADVSGTPSAGFADVRPDKYYADAVNWAARNGYAPERSSGSFAPEEAITREEIAVILYNYLSKTGTVLEPDPAAPASFSDFGGVSADARSAVEYVRWTGLMNGSGGRFDPAGTLTRAQAAEVFMRLGQRLEGAAKAEGWYITTPLIALETSTEDAPYSSSQTWAVVRVTDPYWLLKDEQALGGFFYTFQSSDETVIKVSGDGGLYSPCQLAPGAEPVRATITVTHMDGSQRQLVVLVTAKAAKEEPEPSASPEPDETPFTVRPASCSFTTTIYNPRPENQHIMWLGITDPYLGLDDQVLGSNTYDYTFESSDETVIKVTEKGQLYAARALAPEDKPVTAYITVTNQRDGHSVQVPVTISPDPNWYTVNDEYIAAYAAEALRLVNELRSEAGLKPVSYVFEAQECVNARSAELAVKFDVVRPNGKSEDSILEEFGFDWGVASNIIELYYPAGPKELAEAVILRTAMRGNMLTEVRRTMVIGLYRDENGTWFSALWFN